MIAAILLGAIKGTLLAIGLSIVIPGIATAIAVLRHGHPR
jgi:hypothetical protein